MQDPVNGSINGNEGSFEIALNSDYRDDIPSNVSRAEMRYLTVAADYQQPVFRDDITGPIKLENLGLSKKLCEAVVAWNARYQAIIQLDMDRRVEPDTASVIQRLDDDGRVIVADLK